MTRPGKPPLDLQAIKGDRRAPRRALDPRAFAYSSHPVERAAAGLLARVHAMQMKPQHAAALLAVLGFATPTGGARAIHEVEQAAQDAVHLLLAAARYPALVEEQQRRGAPPLDLESECDAVGSLD